MNRFSIFMLAIGLAFATIARGTGYDPTLFPSYQSIPPLAKPWFKNLSEFVFVPPELMHLAQVPEAEPAMVELMKKIVSDPAGNSEHLVWVIQATKERNDFSAEHQAWLRELLLSKLGRTNGDMDLYLKSYGPGLLRKYPSAENEDLMIKYLKDKDVYDVVPGALDIGLSGAAVDGLRDIGTARAIDPLREYAKLFKPAPGKINHDYNEVMGAIAEIEKRERVGASALHPATETGAAANHKSDGKPARGEDGEQPQSEIIVLEVLVALTVLALVWLTWKKWSMARTKK